MSEELPFWAKVLRDFIFGVASQQSLAEKGLHVDSKSKFGLLEIGATGYDLDKDVQERVAKLLSLQEEATSNPAWFPRDGKTYCNRSSNFIAQAFGYYFRMDALANDMIRAMENDSRWREDSLDRAHMAAMRGGLAFLCLEEQPHGHLCSVAPLPKQDSGSWGKPVLMVANVGLKNGILRSSEVFKAEDQARVRAFILTESIA